MEVQNATDVSWIPKRGKKYSNINQNVRNYFLMNKHDNQNPTHGQQN
jgi:hypothetical protein